MPKPKKTRFTVISPDGLPIAPKPYPTRQAAEDALTDWCRRFGAARLLRRRDRTHPADGTARTLRNQRSLTHKGALVTK